MLSKFERRLCFTLCNEKFTSKRMSMGNKEYHLISLKDVKAIYKACANEILWRYLLLIVLNCFEQT